MWPLYSSLELILSLFVSSAFAGLQFFPDGLTAEFPVSPSCESALTATISGCEGSYLWYPITDYGGPFTNSTARESFCSQGCSSALASYHNSVDTACASDTEPWEGIPAVYAGDRMAAYQKRICLKDPSSGQYCTEFFANYGLPEVDFALPDLPQDYKCSACFLSFLQAMQETPYSNYDESWVEEYAAVQASCGVNYPTEAQPWPLNVTQDVPPGVVYPDDSEPFCLSGNYVTVASGSNCQVIAEANGVCRALYESSIAYSRIARISSAVHRCKWRKYTNVERYGVDQLPSCLPMTCQTYKVQSDDTCWSIAAALDDGTTTTDLISYNPTLNGVCGNLIAGENICISPATGEYIPTIIPGATATQTNVYATETVLPPGPTASDTTTKCGKYYQVQSGDVCQQISLNNTITVDLFRAINPSIDQNCFNLSPSLWYCVRPTFDWNQTDPTITPSVTAIPPAPTAPGTTGSCYTWYTVKSGDYGSLITSSYGITMQRFQQWNPSIDDNCSNLILGNAYCVNGGSAMTSAPSGTSMPLTTSSASASSSAATAISSNGICSPGVTCTGSGFGDCCSIHGYCGSGSDYCSKNNCQSGTCSST